MKAILALENGIWYEGEAAGAAGEAGGEVVFNTSLTGYQEILTDPSYAGQIVTMTCPEIGNYGIAPEDAESRKPQVAGFIVRDESPVASNWRADSARCATTWCATTSWRSPTSTRARSRACCDRRVSCAASSRRATSIRATSWTRRGILRRWRDPTSCSA
jgi:hypothetical protein